MNLNTTPKPTTPPPNISQPPKPNSQQTLTKPPTQTNPVTPSPKPSTPPQFLPLKQSTPPPSTSLKPNTFPKANSVPNKSTPPAPTAISKPRPFGQVVQPAPPPSFAEFDDLDDALLDIPTDIPQVATPNLFKDSNSPNPAPLFKKNTEADPPKPITNTPKPVSSPVTKTDVISSSPPITTVSSAPVPTFALVAPRVRFTLLFH